jgi:hypothetical protein
MPGAHPRTKPTSGFSLCLNGFAIVLIPAGNIIARERLSRSQEDAFVEEALVEDALEVQGSHEHQAHENQFEY